MSLETSRAVGLEITERCFISRSSSSVIKGDYPYFGVF